MRPNVGGEVIRSRERSHANATLERLLASVNSNVTRQLIGTGESSVAIFNGTRVRALVHRRFAGAVWIFAWLYRD